MSVKPGSARSRSTISRSSTRFGNKKGGNVVVGNEKRFQWQEPVNDFDAFYSLPSALSNTATGFGSSTRENWECTYTNKKDSKNPNVGPGSHVNQDLNKLSTKRSSPKYVFGQGPRNESSKFNPGTPGPKYEIDAVYKNGNSQSALKMTFKAGERKLSSAGSQENTLPQKPFILPLPKGSSKTIGIKLDRPNTVAARSPGPVYEMSKYDFKSGPSFSFGAGSTRFKYKKPE